VTETLMVFPGIGCQSWRGLLVFAEANSLFTLTNWFSRAILALYEIFSVTCFVVGFYLGYRFLRIRKWTYCEEIQIMGCV